MTGDTTHAAAVSNKVKELKLPLVLLVGLKRLYCVSERIIEFKGVRQ